MAGLSAVIPAEHFEASEQAAESEHQLGALCDVLQSRPCAALVCVGASQVASLCTLEALQ